MSIWVKFSAPFFVARIIVPFASHGFAYFFGYFQ
jgi:hypothetical protein